MTLSQPIHSRGGTLSLAAAHAGPRASRAVASLEAEAEETWAGGPRAARRPEVVAASDRRVAEVRCGVRASRCPSPASRPRSSGRPRPRRPRGKALRPRGRRGPRLHAGPGRRGGHLHAAPLRVHRGPRDLLPVAVSVLAVLAFTLFPLSVDHAGAPVGGRGVGSEGEGDGALGRSPDVLGGAPPL